MIDPKDIVTALLDPTSGKNYKKREQYYPWDQVDWNQKDIDIARFLRTTPTHVYSMRKRLGKGRPLAATKPTPPPRQPTV